MESNFAVGFGTNSNRPKQTFCEKLKIISTNCDYLKLCLGLSGLYFVVTGLQYWIPDYMTTILQGDPKLVTIYFVIISFTAPVAGVVVGGICTTYYGGYNTKKG
jgi:hypothetical protein